MINQRTRRRTSTTTTTPPPSSSYTYLKALIRSIFFLTMLSVYVVCNRFMNIINSDIVNDEANHWDDHQYHSYHRRLLQQQQQQQEEGTTSCEDDLRKADPAWLCVIYLLGVLYMFVAIAIVCDELFVPTLEEIASVDHLNLSMDVAGATLMAAGGSAPELFTNIFGTFVQHSEVGIGTVVGSAVFNVLFVIAMCAIFSKEILQLTWWPLFRDSSYYSIGLVVLGLFVGVISPNEIELWEAVVLFAMYIGYVVMMAYNRQLYKVITGKEYDIQLDDEAATTVVSNSNNNDIQEEQQQPNVNTASKTTNEDEKDEESPPDEDSHHNRPLPTPPTSVERAAIRSLSARSIVSAISSTAAAGANGGKAWPGTFRSGILKLLRDPESWTDTAGVGIVAVIAGDVHHVFRVVDVDGNGEIDKQELRQLFAKIDCSVPQQDLDNIMKELDNNNDGKITEEDFTVWYIKSESRISDRVGPIFRYFDSDESGTIDRSKIRNLLETLEPGVADDDIEEAMKAMYQSGSRDEISFEEFSDWYIHSIVYQRQVQKVEDEMNGILDSIKPPSSSEGAGFFAYAKYILVLPIVVVLGFTVPDVRRPGCQRFCYISFVLSIIWIGFFSYFMVDWAEVIGHTIGIPSVIMGLTLLAAGTSVPDLLTSVIVARMGEGDMALSSSIGSNIFDILVGLPLPWICYTAWNNSVITIGSDNVWVYIFTLLGMLIFVVAATHCQGWKLTRTLAFLMLVFYFGFLAMAISLELPFETC